MAHDERLTYGREGTPQYGVHELMHKSGARVRFLPEYGATVVGLELPLNGEVMPVMQGSEPAHIPDDMWYRGTLLGPYVGRMPGGKYQWNGRDYTLPINYTDGTTGGEYALHGFMYRAPFTVVPNDEEISGAHMLTMVSEYRGTEPGYPFPFDTHLRYVLGADYFRAAVTVQNAGSKPMPFALGWHPYYTFGGVPIDHLSLKIPGYRSVQLVEGIPDLSTSEVSNIFSSARKIHDRVLDNCYVTGDPENRNPKELRSIQLRFKERKMWLKIFQSGNMPYTQIHTHPDRQSVSVQPRTALPNGFNIPEGPHQVPVLEPLEKTEVHFGVKLLPITW